MITYCTASGETPDLSSAPLMAKPPRSAPVNPASEPSRRPIGVRAPPTMTDVRWSGWAADTVDLRAGSSGVTSLSRAPSSLTASAGAPRVALATSGRSRFRADHGPAYPAGHDLRLCRAAP